VNTYKEIIEDIKRRKLNLENGGVNAIPFGLPSLNKYIPGITKETQFGITAQSGTGKSKFARFLFMSSPYNYYIANKNSKDIDLKIFLFSLEDTVDRVKKYLLIKALFDKKNIRINEHQINSYLDENRLSDSLLKDIDEVYSFLEETEKIVTISDVANPTGIIKEVKEYLLHPSIGTLADQYGNPITRLESRNFKDGKMQYIPTNKNRFVIVIIDNLQNVRPEKGMNKYQALDEFCRHTMRNILCNFYGCTTVLVQQQNQEKAKQQYTISGESVVQKLLPSEDGLGEFKNSVQTMHCLFGLFNPSKYRISSFSTGAGYYNIEKIGDYYRYLNVIKSNFCGNIEDNLFFDYISETFYEMPHTSVKDKVDDIYKKIRNLESINLQSALIK